MRCSPMSNLDSLIKLIFTLIGADEEDVCSSKALLHPDIKTC